MGKNQKIPYLSEVIFYFAKVFFVLFVLGFLFSKTFYYNQPLILILSIFSAFSFNPFYLAMIIFGYIVSFLLTTFIPGGLGLFISYIFSILLSTIFMIVYLKFKLKYKYEEE